MDIQPERLGITRKRSARHEEVELLEKVTTRTFCGSTGHWMAGGEFQASLTVVYWDSDNLASLPVVICNVLD